MPAHVPDTLPEALKTFLGRDRIRKVHVAGPGGVPPQLAYMTVFPRLSVVMAGAHPMLVAGGAAAVRIRPKRGEAVFVPAHHWNKPDWSEPATVLTVLIGRRQLGLSLASPEGSGQEPIATAKVSVAREIDGVVSHLIAALSGLPPGASRDNQGELRALLVASLLHALLTLLAQPNIPDASKARQTYETICLHIQENAHRPLTRESVAAHCELSPSHVSRLFRGQGSMRFTDYLNLVRINRAKVLLIDGRPTVSQIAADCGYADPAYFCRQFRRFVKMTPTEYRASRVRREMRRSDGVTK
jgi:AraC-like DNA-binding protein